MGTRGLTIVVSEGRHRIAQYGQWDHHPVGVGETVLKFCRKFLSTPEARDAFRKKLTTCRFGTQEEFEADGAVLGEDFVRKYPTLDRDMGGYVLEHVMSVPGEHILRDSLDFAGDSLFCEWVYVVDLDAETFEVFKGFNEKPLGPEDRFVDLDRPSPKYHPVRLIERFSLSDLPPVMGFAERFEVYE